MGGPERVFTFTRKELAEYHDRAYWEGFEFGEEQSRKALRDEIRQELEDELRGFDPECDLCRMRREFADVKKQLADVRETVSRLRTVARGRYVREGSSSYIPPIGGHE